MAENNEEGAFSTQATGGNGIRSRRASRRLRRESHDYDIDGNPLEGDGARTQAVFVRRIDTVVYGTEANDANPVGKCCSHNSLLLFGMLPSLILQR